MGASEAQAFGALPQVPVVEVGGTASGGRPPKGGTVNHETRNPLLSDVESLRAKVAQLQSTVAMLQTELGTLYDELRFVYAAKRAPVPHHEEGK